ncbi:MAG: transglycosylase SLT domain-containing protein, partial [Thermodesulfobacteriota bacterium]
YKSANTYLDKIDDKIPELEDYVLYYKSLYQKKSGNNEKAEKLLKKSLKKYPNSSIKEKERKFLAEIYTEEKKFDLAKSIYKQIIDEARSEWTKATYLKSLGELYETSNNRSEAFATYKKIWASYPTVSFSNYIFEYANKNSLVFIPQSSDYLTRAEFFYVKSLWPNALIEFKKSPQTQQVLIKTAVCYHRLGDYKMAVDILSEIKTPESLYWIALSTKKIGYEFEAAKMLSSITTIYPESEYASMGLLEAGEIYEKENDTVNAVKVYKELIAKYPTSDKTGMVAWKLGWSYYKKKNYEEAFSVFSAYKFPDNSFDVHSFKYWKAKTFEKLGKKEDANLIYKELAASVKFTYHSYLSRIKTGSVIKEAKATSINFDKVFSGDPSKRRADIFFKMGILNLVIDEINYLETIASNIEDNLYIASLYLKIENYYSSIKAANIVDSNGSTYLSYPRGYEGQVKNYSRKYNLNELLVYSLIREESRFDKGAVSSSNARGLMQLIPFTATETAGKVGILNFNLDKLFIPEINVELGCFYLRYVLDRFGENIPLALAGYNAGPTRAAEWYESMGSLPLDEFIEEIPFSETRAYVKRILRSYGAYQAIYGSVNKN